MIFISNDKPPEILEPSKKSFHFPSPSIWSQFAPILGFRFLSSLSMRRHHFNSALFKKLFIKLVTVIRFIPNQFIRCIFRKTTVYCCFHKLYFMGRSAFNVSGDRNTRSVCDCHDLGAFAALCLADSKTPFFAGAKLPSMNASRILILPRSFRSSASCWAIPLKTPCFTHFWNHLWHVWYGGYLWGKSFQGAPVRSIHRMPLSTCLWSLGDRPLGSLGGVNSLIIGSIRFHCSFVMSILIILHNQPLMSSFIFNYFG